MFLKVFGKNPSGKELEKVKRSPNYRNGSFQNLSKTVVMAEDTSFFKAAGNFLKKPKDTVPPGRIPSVSTDLTNLPDDSPVIVWFGHSSYLIKTNGRNILVDPVFSGNASPFTFAVKCYDGSNVYQAADMPDIDLLIITHDHYDHLDYKTILALKPRIKHICTSLGVASHLVYWGFNKTAITEFDWWQGSEVLPDIRLTAVPARHFSGRFLLRGKTLWSSFILQCGNWSLYLGGDSGYDRHFKEIGDKYGPFDIALLETGQYNTSWPQIHMMPEETVQAAIDLKAKVLMPVHWGKFALALHSWNEPVTRLVNKAVELNVKVTTPMIGEPVVLSGQYPSTRWWDKDMF